LSSLDEHGLGQPLPCNPSSTLARHLLFVEHRVLAAAGPLATTPAFNVAGIARTGLIVGERPSAASRVNALFSGMPCRRLAVCAHQMPMYFHDASILD
jgi:hypothetical protein